MPSDLIARVLPPPLQSAAKDSSRFPPEVRPLGMILVVGRYKPPISTTRLSKGISICGSTRSGIRFGATWEVGGVSRDSLPRPGAS